MSADDPNSKSPDTTKGEVHPSSAPYAEVSQGDEIPGGGAVGSEEVARPGTGLPYAALEDPNSLLILQTINRALNEIDPGFKDSVADISSALISSNLESESLPIDDKLLEQISTEGSPENVPPPKNLRELAAETRLAFKDSLNEMILAIQQRRTDLAGEVRSGAKNFVPNSLNAGKQLIVGLKNGLRSLGKVGKKGYLTILGILILSAACWFIVSRTFQGGFLPRFETKFLRTYETVADRSFTYPPDEEFEEFNSPLRHPEYVVAIDKVVVNLKSSTQSTNPMGMFEFYIEAGSKEAAIEVNNREKEVRDVMSRTIEGISFEEVATIPGKNKLKLILRKDINRILTRGRVRRVFIKSIVLKS